MMHCLICGKELQEDYQLCEDCFINLIEKEPLWHCRNFMVGESIPDLLANNSVVALTLSVDKFLLVGGKKPMDDLYIPEEPEFEDAEKIFWKINMYMEHMGISPYVEDYCELELNTGDVEELIYMLKLMERLDGFAGASEEDALSRISTIYYYAHHLLDYLHGVEINGIKNGKKKIYSRVSKYVSMASKIMPQKGIAETNRGFLDIKLHRYRDAIAHFKRVRKYEKNPRVLTNIGMAFEGMGMYEDSDEYYVRALREDENYVKAWIGRASVALSMKKWGAALQFASKAIELRPNYADAHIMEGDIFMAQNLSAEAKRSYEKASNLKGGEKATLKMAYLMHNTGKWGAALQFIERYNFLVPNDREGWVLKGRILKERGDKEGAKKAYERALKIRSSPDIKEEMKGL